MARKYRAHPEPSFLVPNELDHFLRPPAEPIPVLVTIHPFPDDENILLAEIVPADKTLQMTRERHMNELSENTRRLLRISLMKLRILSEGFEAQHSSWKGSFTIRKIKNLPK